MKLEVTPTGQSCGARVAGVDLTRPLSPETVAQLRAAWLEHHVLVFPEQAMSDDDLERFTLYFGPFGDDPYIAPIPGREHIIAVERRADETSTIFADTFHSDWSFQEHPPQGTCLFGITIPPRGGNTFYSNQHLALEAMPAEMRERFEAKTAIRRISVQWHVTVETPAVPRRRRTACGSCAATRRDGWHLRAARL